MTASAIKMSVSFFFPGVYYRNTWGFGSPLYFSYSGSYYCGMICFFQQLLSVSLCNELALGQVPQCEKNPFALRRAVSVTKLSDEQLLCSVNPLLGKSPLQLHKLLWPKKKDLLQEWGQGENVFWCPADFLMP